MKSWPDFDDKGDLPVGIHQATLTEVVRHFGMGTTRRRVVARRLSRVYELAAAIGHLSRFIIFGSFVTSKPDPNDVDIFLVMEDTFSLGQISDETRIVFDHLKAQEVEGVSVFWLKKSGAVGGEQAAVEDWQIRRDKEGVG